MEFAVLVPPTEAFEDVVELVMDVNAGTVAVGCFW
jgi:uncharacterized protein (DUF2126 family)